MNTNDLQDASFQTQQDNSQDQESSTFTNRARALKDTAQQWQRQATDATRKAAKATDVYVQENPWSIIGSVAVGCFAIGLLLGRSRD